MATHDRAIVRQERHGLDTQHLTVGSVSSKLQILYGVDRNGNGAPDAFIAAGDPGTGAGDSLSGDVDWRQVVAVKIALLVRSPNEYQDLDLTLADYQLLDENVVPGDNRRRRVFTTMALLRNLQ